MSGVLRTRGTGFRVLVLPVVRLGEVRVNGGQAVGRAHGRGGQRALPLLEEPAVHSADCLSACPPATASTDLTVLAQRLRGTRFVELKPRSVINSPEATGMGFWSLNPYVGCEFGCTYCYARYAHRYVVERAHDRGALGTAEFQDYRGAEGWEAFESRIFVKSRRAVLDALERDLGKVRRRRAEHGQQNLVIGTATDPYQPAERQYQITRAVLKRLVDERELRVGIITKSPLIVRDLDVLSDLTRRNGLSIYISLISADVRVIKTFEARSPMPHARLRALEKLTGAGLRAGLIVAPILPGISDSGEQLDRLLAAARDAGARFAYPVPLRLYPATTQRFLPLVEQHFPALAQRYRDNYGKEWNAPDGYVRALRQRFHRLAVRYGIPDTDGDREQPVERSEPQAQQLSLL